MINLSLFSKARLHLTLYYALIFVTLSGLISGLFYYRTSQVLESEYDRMERRFQLEINDLNPSGMPRMVVRRIQPEDLAIAKQRIIFQLLGINGVILLLVALAGYFLSDRTLAPLEASMHQQKRFMSDIAHEIKTPLTALRTSLEVNLMDKKLSPAVKTLLQENLEDVTHLDELTTSMLKLSKNYEQPLESTAVTVLEIINRAVHLTKASAKAKKITIDLQPIPNNCRLNGDKAALTDVVKILIDNAIKYSPAATTITIVTLLHRQHLEIKVQDEGFGIAPADLPHIFDRFYRVDAARTQTKNQMSYGLGLSIAKTIVEYHRGTISVSSKPGSGSTFTISLPRN